MATRRVSSRTPVMIVCAIVAVCLALFGASFIGFTFAGANASSEHAPAEFGLSETTSIDFTATWATQDPESVEEDDLSESVALENTAKRDMSQGVQEIAAEEEAARKAAEEKARREEAQRIEAAAEAKAASVAAGAPNLPDVDFSCGRDAFLAEWTERIDNYLEGSALDGYGSVFAEAAWDNAVDPRWSPAISNTESTKGANCFRSHNAWGWMGTYTWSSWDEAIRDHVAGLANGYGYTITLANAAKYCPPTYVEWYEKTLAEMMKI